MMLQLLLLEKNDNRIHFWNMIKTKAMSMMKSASLSEKKETTLIKNIPYSYPAIVVIKKINCLYPVIVMISKIPGIMFQQQKY